ncbi:hypothetical protein BDW75DRAFT_205520 [Aspergillus navahoensis]
MRLKAELTSVCLCLVYSPTSADSSTVLVFYGAGPTVAFPNQICSAFHLETLGFPGEIGTEVYLDGLKVQISSSEYVLARNYFSIFPNLPHLGIPQNIPTEDPTYHPASNICTPSRQISTLSPQPSHPSSRSVTHHKPDQSPACRFVWHNEISTTYAPSKNSARS